MSNISDLIEHFILETLGDEQELSLSRNNMAEYFNCAPSQINYVLSTRFNFENGYLIESKKGGSGYIKIIRLEDSNEYLKNLYTYLSQNEITFSHAVSIVETLYEKNLITSKEKMIITSALSPKSLVTPIRIENKLRSNILLNIISSLSREKFLWYVQNASQGKHQ